MKVLKKLLAIVLCLTIIYGILPDLRLAAHAEALPVNLYVQKFDNGSLTLRWDQIPNAKSIVLNYHIPNSTDDPQARIDRSNQTTNSFTVASVLKADYIYDFELQIYDDADGAGNMIGRGFIYYLPKMTFQVSQLPQAGHTITGGGKEAGTDPGLYLRWKMPKVYNGVNKFVYANSVLSNMQNTINAVYTSQAIEISKMDFRINLSTDYGKLNSGSSQASVLISTNNSGEYIANVSGNNSVTAKVSGLDSGGYMSFSLIGRADNIVDPVKLTDPIFAAYPADQQLLDWDIYPGTVYYMSIKPIFKNSTGNNINVVSACSPEDQNGSGLTGAFPYAYTPIRFQLTKDATNNLYVKIFKINQGSLDLPRLYYQVQASDDGSIPGDWAVKKTMDDSYFVGEYALTVITGINANNEIFYKIVVKSDSPNDRLESPKLPYTLSIDNSKPPVPMNIRIEKREYVTKTQNNVVKKSTNVVISWDKPLNWDTIVGNTDPDEDIVYHFLLSTAQQDQDIQPLPELTAEGKSYGNFEVKYRLVKYVGSKTTVLNSVSPDINYLRANGNRLEYTLQGFDSLFTGYYWSSNDAGGNPVISLDDANQPGISNPDTPPYPDFLLPNKVYYLQMYTTKGDHRASQAPEYMSDKSLITTFTTLSGIERDVPVVKNFKVTRNNADITKNPSGQVTSISNYVELQFDKADIDWKYYTTNTAAANKVYYDLYMSTRPDPDSFTLIGSTDPASGLTDVGFTGVEGNSVYITGVVRNFTGAARTTFGTGLKPNTTYYFVIKTRLSIVSPPDTKVSLATSLLPVTTITASSGTPDTSNQSPLAPTDFKISSDADGNPLVTGTSAVFDWGRKEVGVEYEIICTSTRLSPDATYDSYKDDPYFKSFSAKYTAIDGNGNDDRVYLDPTQQILAAGFDYNSLARLYSFKTDGWLTPNRLYYFSLRARYLGNGNESVWVCIPLTTNLIEAPTNVEAVNDCELGFFWEDSDPVMKAEDYRVMVKGPRDNDYRQLNRSGCTVVKEDSWYYGRIYNLLPNSQYNIRVYKGAEPGTLVYEETGVYTRDSYHQVELKWKGRAGYTYEIAIKAADDDDYTILAASDLEQYADGSGALNPYYVEKSALTSGTDYSYFYARVNTVEVVIPGGAKVHRPLKSNTKYSVKVRAVKEIPSKYAGPAETRTEYNKDDYDNADREEQQKAIFLDRVNALEEGYFWKLSLGNGTATRILLKADRIVNAMKYSGNQPFVLDISQLSINIDTDVLLIPSSIIETMNSRRKSLVIRIKEAEYTIRPDSINTETAADMKSIKSKAGVKNVIFELAVTRLVRKPQGTPAGMEAASRFNDLQVRAIGTGKSDTEIARMIHDKLYDENTGLVSQKLNILLGSGYVGNSSKVMEQQVSELIGLIEFELSNYIQSSVETIKVYGAAADIRNFDNPAQARLSSNGVQGARVPYVQYYGTITWKKLTKYQTVPGGTSFDITGTGRLVLLVGQQQATDVAPGYWAGGEIKSFLQKYDLSDIFTSLPGSFNPEDTVTTGEIILIYEKVLGRSADNQGTDLKNKARNLGLDGFVNINGLMGNVRRQEAAAIIIKAYSLKTGMDPASYKAGKQVTIKDETGIGDRYYSYVLMAVDGGIMNLDAGGSFLPKADMSRAEVVTAFTRMLKKVGEL